MKKLVVIGAVVVVLGIFGWNTLKSHLTSATTANQPPVTTSTVVSIPQQIAALKVEVDTSNSVTQGQLQQIIDLLNQILANQGVK
jgi:hypothetical protein